MHDLDFAEDIALISSTQQQMQETTSLLAETFWVKDFHICAS
jgi:hypothetical protein